ncbi:hypothetical protein [Catellatospora sp. NPDC049133]|uniref:hypothetical protein n=1 Tax=Catellatospora sp. NPDC049133 TaxID=3155499 RepID=UPI0033DA824E
MSLNDTYHHLTPGRHRKTSCHELGHAIDIGHATSSASCMISGSYETLYPSADDWALLANVIY